MQSVSSKIWTRVAVSISYDDNHYTTGTKFILTNPIVYVTNELAVVSIDIAFMPYNMTSQTGCRLTYFI